jgi:hypothetical protein
MKKSRLLGAVCACIFSLISISSHAALVSYAQDFEAVNAADAGALGYFGENFKIFADVWGADGGYATVDSDIFLYNYGPFSAPNGGPGFSAVASGEGGVAQGTQYLTVYSDYNNSDQAAGGSCGSSGCTINTSVFQEQTIDATDIGSTWTLTFDAKSPLSGGIFDAALDNGGNIDNPTSAYAFIRTLDPYAGYATTNHIRIDMTDISNTEWGSFSISLNIDSTLDGQIVWFGFNNVTTDYDSSGLYYDNICFDNTGGCPTALATPIPAAAWLFGSGLLGLIGMARRKAA